MKTKSIIIALITTAFFAVSCGGGGSSSVDAALSKIEKAIEKVEKNKTSMTEADWEALSKELEQPAKVLSDALENNQIGAMKKLKISAVMMRYAVVLGEAAIHTYSDSLKVVMDGVNTDELKEAVEGDDMKQAMEEMKKAADELQKALKK